jgi:hypothetical protein
MSVKKRAAAAMLVGSIFAAGPAAAGPVSALYLADFGLNYLVVQGDGVIDSWAQAPAEVFDPSPAIAVMSTVRAYGQGFSPSSTGYEYTLDGTPTGASYLNTVGCCFRDGTTDGVYNYAIRQMPAANDVVYRFDLDWGNPEALDLNIGFSLDNLSLGIGKVSGIAFDPRDSSLWFSDVGGFVFNIRMDGLIQAGFLYSPAMNGALAFDPADNTLWMTDYNPGSFTTTLYQYSSEKAFDGRGISPMSTLTLAIGAIGGAEFALASPAEVPEPAMIGLFGLGVLGLGMMRRRTAA